MTTHLLLDADIIAYRAAELHQRVTDWGDGAVSVAVDPVEDAIETMRDEVAEIKRALGGGVPIFCLSDSASNFRKTLLPTYKAGRKVKPVLLPKLREWILANTKAYLRPGLEGDDVIGILATHPKLLPGSKIIVSIDKDMKTIPGTIYNPRRDDLMKVSAEEAHYWHLFQTLTGDPVDNYKGCPGVGPVKAAAILDRTRTLEGEHTLADAWANVCDAYHAKGLTEDDALVQARVARILRASDYNFKTKEPILWQPPR